MDEERAPFIRWAFEQYATGEYSIVDLLADATVRGLTTIPTPQRPSGPVARSTFFKILRNPYYISLFCGTCGSRLQFDLPTNKQGIQYAYCSCSGRRTRKTTCTRRAIPVAVAEQLVADGYARISINEAQYAALAQRATSTPMSGVRLRLKWWKQLSTLGTGDHGFRS